MEWTRGRTIGRGTIATVSLAVSASSGEVFAVKSTELSQSRFLRQEQHFLSKLSSPYVVKYMGSGISNENNKLMYNLCMEYVHGGTLHDVIQRLGGQLDEPMIRLYTRHILQGLDYLHTNRLVHCDIKSQNVLINKDGAKITDFGCARSAEDLATDGGSSVSAFSGTPAFMAPEVARGEEQRFPADVWALGCTIVEMSTGSNPWAGLKDPISALYRIGFSSDVPECPSWLSNKANDFLSKCFMRDPKQRWTARELLDHPFLDELKFDCAEIKEFTKTSPTCVLDKDNWDSMDALESSQNLTIETHSDSPAERIKRLVELSPPAVSNIASWTFEEDWITVRRGEFEEIGNNLILTNEPTVATETLSISPDQELASSILEEDLPSEFNRENVSNASENVRTSRVDDSQASENISITRGDFSTGRVDGFESRFSIFCSAILVLLFLNLNTFCFKIYCILMGKYFAVKS